MARTTRRILSRDTYLDLLRAHEALVGEFRELFREHGLTLPQYNVLRILRGGDAGGVSCQDIGERLVNRVPDVTRLVDRMVDAGLVDRRRSPEDRRVVLVTLTKEGRRRCDALDGPVLDLHEAQFAHLPRTALEGLARGLADTLAR